MNKPHKYCEVIKAWADGKDIQGMCITKTNPTWDDWKILDATPAFSNFKWRIKPETLKYRVALKRDEVEGFPVVDVVTCGLGESDTVTCGLGESDTEEDDEFVK